MKIKHYILPEGRHLTLPIGLLPAPGAMNMRVKEGETFSLDHDAPNVQQHGRFIANRIKVGDLVEVDEKTAATAPKPAQAVPSSSAKPAPFEVSPLSSGGK